MKSAWRVEIPVFSATIGLLVGIIFFAYPVHEAGHALACLFYKVPFTITFSNTTPKVPVSGITAIVIGLSGGALEAITALIALLLSIRLEKKSANWFLASFGLQFAFFTIFLVGLSNSILEGLFSTTYESVFDSVVFLLIDLSIASVLSLVFMKVWKYEKMKNDLTLESL